MYSNINGKEEKLEREFDNARDFDSFVRKFPGFRFWRWPEFLSLRDWSSLYDYVDELLSEKLRIPFLSWSSQTTTESLPDVSWVDLSKYEQALQEIEYQKTHKEEHIKSLKSTLKQLKEYKKKFQEENKDDLVNQVEEDIKKVEDQLKQLQG